MFLSSTIITARHRNQAPTLLDVDAPPRFLTQLGHYVLDHECLPGAGGEDIFPGLEDELGRGVAGVPLLQGAGQLAADGRVERLQARLREGQPRVHPRVDGDGVCQRVPVFHLQEERGKGSSSRGLRGSHTVTPVLSWPRSLSLARVWVTRSPLRFPQTGTPTHQQTHAICIKSQKWHSSDFIKEAK